MRLSFDIFVSRNMFPLLIRDASEWVVYMLCAASYALVLVLLNLRFCNQFICLHK